MSDTQRILVEAHCFPASGQVMMLLLDMLVTEALKNRPFTLVHIILLCLKPFLQVQIYARK